MSQTKKSYKKNTDAESTYTFLLIPVLQCTSWIMWFNASSSNPSVWNLELKIHLKNLLIFVIWFLFNSLVNSDKLLALQTLTPMATWETQPHYQLRISSCLLYNASSSSSNPLKILNIFFPTSRTPINHKFQSAGRKTPELEYYYRSITEQQYTEFWDNYICTYIFINSVHHNVPSSLFLVQPSSQAQLQLQQVHQAFRQAWYLGLHL